MKLMNDFLEWAFEVHTCEDGRGDVVLIPLIAKLSSLRVEECRLADWGR